MRPRIALKTWRVAIVLLVALPFLLAMPQRF
jgi:hypothetical protein